MGAILSVFILSVLIVYTTQPVSAYTKRPKKESRVTFSVLSYNVENLFDAQDDPGKDDQTYLPAALKNQDAHVKHCLTISKKAWREECLYLDWHATAVDHKVKALAKVILEATAQGPDIVVLAEVENDAALRMLQQALGVQRYPHRILVEGNDKRGIDVAMLSRFKVVGQPQLHPISFSSISTKQRQDTRGILETRFVLPSQEEVVVYANHFPAPFHPSEMRLQAFHTLNELKKRYPSSLLQIAAGDFNVTASENKGGHFLEKALKDHWLIAHEKACEGFCLGTYYYPPAQTWSFLDMILLAGPVDQSNWQLEKLVVINQSVHQLDNEGFPISFDYQRGQGASDHLPLLAFLQRALD
jgi:endonuclease/exonuclease/phosphatase family metal-dependent hydrolase